MATIPSKRYQKLRQYQRPSPYNYKRLMEDKTFLKCQKRAMGIGVEIQSVDFQNMEVHFKTKSQSVQGKYYETIFKLGDLKSDDFISGKNVAELLRSAKIKVYSNNPAFLYWGVAYWSWKGGWGLYPERRFPKVRNPRHKMYVGKHVYACLMVFPFIVGKLGKMFKQYFTEEQEKQFSDVVDSLVKHISVEDLM